MNDKSLMRERLRVMLVTTNRRPYGSERVVKILANGLRQAGCDVAILCVNEGWLAKSRRDDSHVVFGWSRFLPIGIVNLICRHRIRNWKPDIINSHTPKALDLIETVRNHIPHLVTLHTEQPRKSHVNNRSSSIRFVAVCEVAKMNAIQQGIPETSIDVIVNGLPLSHFQPVGNEMELPPDAQFMVAIGRMSKDRCTDLLLRAWPGIAGRRADAHLVLLGNPVKSFQAEYNRLLSNLPYRERLILPGLVEDVRPWLSKATLVVHLSKTDALPMAIMEAMAAGKPVIASDAGGIVEAVENGVNGLIIPRSVNALEDAVCSLLENPERRRQFGERSRALAEDRFTVERMSKQYHDVFLDEIQTPRVGCQRERLCPSVATSAVSVSSQDISM